MKFKQLIQNKNPYYLEIGNQLFNEDKNEIINYFKKNTEENEELIEKVINIFSKEKKIFNVLQN